VNAIVEQKNNRLVLKLILLAVGMVGFCVALIPLYGVMTDMSGINGKLEMPNEVKVVNFRVDQSRVINLDLITSLGKNTPIQFSAETNRLQIHPGQVYDVKYTVQNISDKTIKVHANPSVSPGLAAAQVKLVSCFCSDNQNLEAGEKKQVTMQFVVDPVLPAQYKNIALAQQFFNIQ
jgi:cytochrome c oxidase assembly protein subunit 11